MGYLDRINGAGNLYIGGLFSLRRTEAVKEANISHVVSVMRYDMPEQMIQPFRHLQIEVDDEDDENLLEFFPTTNKFIEDALEAGGSVFVHCAMGKSRSATVVSAHLMQKYSMTPEEALERIRESRGVCDPNDGFKRQLKLYYSMNMPDDVENHPMYQRWLYQRELYLSRMIKQAPDPSKIRFEDEQGSDESAGEVEYKCRKCRRTLANSKYLISHQPKQKLNATPDSNSVDSTTCSHYFVEALSWMRPELEQGKLEGRLECPKCHTNIGKYAWQGMQCSCGDWVVPGISLAKSRIDESRAQTALKSALKDTSISNSNRATRGDHGNL